jgi:Xaa-Pro aminopeptidase
VIKGAVYKEAELADFLTTYRQQIDGYVGDSFETISSVGRNASVIHYKAEAGSEEEVRADRKTKKNHARGAAQ